MALFDAKIQNQLRTVLNQMQNDVTLFYFTQEIECQTCRDGHQFVEEIASLSDKLHVKTHNLISDEAIAQTYKVDKVPAIVILDQDEKNTGMRYFGIPGGYEINSFLASILAASGKKETIPAALQERIDRIDKPIHLQVFVSLGCPHCPNAVMAAHILALASEHVTADMVESSTFNHLAIRYSVSSVPKTIVNDEIEFTGAQPLAAFLDAIEKA